MSYKLLITLLLLTANLAVSSQILLEFGNDSLIINHPLPEGVFEPRKEPIIFCNEENGMVRTYTPSVRYAGLQFKNGTKNIMYNSILLGSEPDSLCREQSCYHPSWHNSPVLGVHGKGTKLVFRGSLFKGDNTYTKTSLALFDRGHFVFGKDVVVDLVFPRYGNYTRQMWIFGDGTGVFELEEGFKADRSAHGTTNISFGSVRLSNVNFITHNTEAIPHYYMADDNDPETVLRNAHLVFENDPGGKWIVKTNDQQYEGGIQVYTHCGIHTESNLLLDGWVNHWPNKGYTDFGGIVFYHDSLTLTKTGHGSLTFDCDMLFSPASTLLIEQGNVVFKRNPFQQHTILPRNFKHGNHLGINVANQGTLTIDTDTLQVRELYVSHHAKLVTSINQHIIVDQMQINGSVYIHLGESPKKGEYRIFNSGAAITPEQIKIIQKDSDGMLDTQYLSTKGVLVVH